MQNVFQYLDYSKQYVDSIHFAHFNTELLSGRGYTPVDKLSVSLMLTQVKSLGIKRYLLLNLDNYDFDCVDRYLDTFYLPASIDGVVASDSQLIKHLKMEYPDLEIQGSCISHIETMSQMEEYTSLGVSILNPAVWKIRNKEFITQAHMKGFKQKYIFSEGCFYKCPFEYKHRHNMSIYSDNDLPCINVFKSFRDLLNSDWITLSYLKSIEQYIDCVKVPRNTFSTWYDLQRMINIYDNDISYNILSYFSTPFKSILSNYNLDSSIFNNEMFVNEQITDLHYKHILNSKKIDRRLIDFFNK